MRSWPALIPPRSTILVWVRCSPPQRNMTMPNRWASTASLRWWRPARCRQSPSVVLRHSIWTRSGQPAPRGPQWCRRSVARRIRKQLRGCSIPFKWGLSGRVTFAFPLLGKALHDRQGFFANVMLHALGINPRGAVTDTQGAQKLQDNGMALVRHRRHRLALFGQEQRAIRLAGYQPQAL